MVMWKPMGRIRRLAARSTPSGPSVINPGRSKSPLLLSAKFSAQSELNDFFRLLPPCRCRQKWARPFYFCEGI